MDRTFVYGNILMFSLTTHVLTAIPDLALVDNIVWYALLNQDLSLLENTGWLLKQPSDQDPPCFQL